jgi:hypothetical protein
VASCGTLGLVKVTDCISGRLRVLYLELFCIFQLSGLIDYEPSFIPEALYSSKNPPTSLKIDPRPLCDSKLSYTFTILPSQLQVYCQFRCLGQLQLLLHSRSHLFPTHLAYRTFQTPYQHLPLIYSIKTTLYSSQKTPQTFRNLHTPLITPKINIESYLHQF